MKNYYIIFVSALLMLLILGCNTNDPASAEEELELSAVVEEQASFGLELNEIVGTTQEMVEVTHDPSLLPDEDLDGYASVVGSGKMAVDLMNQSIDNLPPQLYLAKPLVDTLLYYEDNVLLGKRSAIYYDGSTGLLRAYEVKYKFAVWQKMTYDSMEIVIDLNMTPNNGQDDMLKTIYRAQNFEANYFVQNIVSSITVTDFSDQEITGLEATVDSYYKEDRYLSHLKQSIDIEPNGTGTLREDFDFSDGTSSFHMLTFNGDHTGSFTRQMRDGTLISGTFNDVNDDLHGSYTETIDFPAGRYLDKISKYAEVSITLPDSIFYASLSKAVYFSSGRIDSANVEVVVQHDNGVKTTSLDVTKANGAHGTFLVQENSEIGTLSGQWTTWNNYFIIVSAEYYSDGSGHIHYDVYEPPYVEGNTPVLTVDYYISPDGSGNGTIVHDGNTYQVNFKSLDQAEITLGNKHRTVNLYR